MRLFAAAAFDSCTKSKISDFYDELRKAGVNGNFTPADNLHLTLKFLGEVPYAQIDSVKSALDRAVGSYRAFELKSLKCGCFTSRGEKTIWLGFGGVSLAALAESVDEELSHLNFERERRAFTPHVTLTRRAGCESDVLERLQVPSISSLLDCVTLFESRRDCGRLWYKPLYKAKF